MIFGAGAPSASHGMVASLPSRAVMFPGGLIMMGDEAETTKKGISKKYKYFFRIILRLFEDQH